MSISYWQGKRVLVTGAHGFVGGHLVDALRQRGVQGDALRAPLSGEADLRDRAACERVVAGVDVVLHLAAHVGGIGLNQERPGELFYDTALMGLCLMEAARKASVEKLVAFGTTCSYPSHAPIPLREENLWDGYPDRVTGYYGLAKKMLLVQAEAYRAQYGFNSIYLIPVNLYGPRDHFDERWGHVVPSLVKRLVEATERGDPRVTVWGTGHATREFLYVEDAADAVLLACERYDGGDPVNLGSGRETPIRELAELIADATGYPGELVWDESRPDGQPRRSVDVSRAKELFGFEAQTPLEVGIQRTVDWYRAHR